MKILWLTNTPTVKIKKEIINSNVTTGGWLDGISEELLKENINLFILFPFASIQSGEVNGCKYQSFIEKDVKGQQVIFQKTIDEFNPDVIHIFGTEYHHTLVLIELCKTLGLLDKTIISIQGLKSVYATHYYSNLPARVIHSYTFRDLLKFDNIARGKKKFEIGGKDEVKALKLAKNVIGRTDWDKACSYLINPELNYYFCNETLRSGFYNRKWELDNCEKHSIFVSQSNYPIKGFHILIKAFLEVLKFYPDAKIYTTGKDLMHLSFKDKIKLNSYQKYIIRLIKKNKLENNIVFKGSLNENGMIESYLNANVFVSASSIENSPNSVGEAMLLGVPTIASDVGGVKDMLIHKKEGLVYPFDEPYMLAYYICEMLKNDEMQIEFSENARKHASETHNPKVNNNQLIEIYNKLSK